MGLSTQRVWKVLRSPDCFSIWQFAGIRGGEVEGRVRADTLATCCPLRGKIVRALLLTKVMDLHH
jgi:hypothetical protein